jgi:hypothetical protein
MMNLNVKYRGRIATTNDVQTIKQVINENPHFHRTALSKRLCEIWDWRQANGALRDMVCRGFLLALERANYITLPPKRRYPNNPFVNRKKPAKITVDTTTIKSKVPLLKPLMFIQVRYTNLEKVFNSLIEQYHYLGYCHPVGEQLKYMVYKNDRPIACFAWSSAARHIGSRDKYIGWNQSLRKKNLHLMAYNSRFLILPWVKVKYLASHLLAEMTKRLPVDWQQVYAHPVYYLETFVDKSLFKGTCYKAANWIYLGDTKGLGKDAKTKKVNRSIKAVMGYPLVKDFREKLCSDK